VISFSSTKMNYWSKLAQRWKLILDLIVGKNWKMLSWGRVICESGIDMSLEFCSQWNFNRKLKWIGSLYRSIPLLLCVFIYWNMVRKVWVDLNTEFIKKWKHVNKDKHNSHQIQWIKQTLKNQLNFDVYYKDLKAWNIWWTGLIKQNLESSEETMNQNTETEKNRELIYLLVNTIPAQKLPIQRKITHFLDITLLGSKSPLLFQVIVFQKNLPTLQLARKIHAQNHEPNCKRQPKVREREKIWNWAPWREEEEERRERERENKNREVLCFGLAILLCSFLYPVPRYALLCVVMFSLFGVCVFVFAGKGSWRRREVREDWLPNRPVL